MRKRKQRIPNDDLGKKCLYWHCRAKALAHSLMANRSGSETMAAIHLRFSETYNAGANSVSRMLDGEVGRYTPHIN